VSTRRLAGADSLKELDHVEALSVDRLHGGQPERVSGRALEDNVPADFHLNAGVLLDPRYATVSLARFEA
jgi:hypothetical protein